MPRVVEAMDAHLDRAVALHVIHLQRTGNEFAGRFAADILLYAVGQCGLAESEATLIVVKLDIIDKERTELRRAAPPTPLSPSDALRSHWGTGFQP